MAARPHGRSGHERATDPVEDLSPQVGERAELQAIRKTGATGLEPATSGVTGRRSNQLNYAPRGQPVYLASLAGQSFAPLSAVRRRYARPATRQESGDTSSLPTV